MPPKVVLPRMLPRPVHSSSLAWYHPKTPGLEHMVLETREGTVSLTYQHPDPTSDLVGVPRYLAPDPAPEGDHRAVGAFEFHADFVSTLRPEQVPFVESVFNTLETKTGCIGEAPTGFGKTVTGCWLTAKIGRPTCIVIPKGDLDWKPELLKHTTIPADKIDVWQGKRLPDPKAWVVIAMLQSIYRPGVYPSEVYNRFACVIFDEVHRLGTDEFGQAIRKFPAMFRLGLSATPDRRDGRMPLIHSHIGDTHIVGHTDAQQPDYYVLPTTWTEPLDRSGKPLKFNPARTDHAKRSLLLDQVRNAAIAGAAVRAHKAGRRTIIFVEQGKHGDRLEAAIKGSGVAPTHIIRYDGGSNSETRARAKECPAGIILIATLKFTQEGTNIPLLDTAILAHPMYDPRQTVGRITRKPPDGYTKPIPVLIDVWDQNSPTLKAMALARWKFLRGLGATWKGEWR